MSGTVIDALVVTLGLDAKDYKNGADAATQQQKKLVDSATATANVLEAKGKQLGNFWASFKNEALAVMAILGGSGGIVALLKSAVEVSGDTARLSQNVGTSVSKLSAWVAVARQVNATAGDVSGAFNSVSTAAQAQRHGQQNATGAFIQNYMRIPLLNSDGSQRDSSDIMNDISAVYRQNDATTDNWFNSQLGFSQGFGNELRMQNLPSQLAKSVTETQAEADAAQKLQAAEGQLAAQFDTLKNQIMLSLSPEILTLAGALEKVDWVSVGTTISNMGIALGKIDWASLASILTDLGAPATALNSVQSGFNAAGADVHDAAQATGNFILGVGAWLAGPRGIRNNNPLNLKYAGQSGAYADSDGFAVFGSIGAGIAGDYRQLLLDQSRGASTLAQLITKWAPPGDNDTAAYISAVSKRTGIGPNQIVNLRDPGTAIALISAMSAQEGSGPISPRVSANAIRSVLGLANGVRVSPPADALSNATSPLNSRQALIHGLGLPSNVTALINSMRVQQGQQKVVRPVTITGDIIVHTTAKDSDGIAKSIKNSLNNQLVMMTNSGVN